MTRDTTDSEIADLEQLTAARGDPTLRWPRGRVVRSAAGVAAPEEHQQASGGSGGSIEIALNGQELQSLDALTNIVSDRLQLPAFTTGSPERVASAVDRRLFVMEKANEFVTVTLHHADAVPEAVLTYLLKWVTSAPLRLVFGGTTNHSQDSVAILDKLGIELLDLDESVDAIDTATTQDVVPPPERGSTIERASQALAQKTTVRAPTPSRPPGPSADDLEAQAAADMAGPEQASSTQRSSINAAPAGVASSVEDAPEVAEEVADDVAQEVAQELTEDVDGTALLEAEEEPSNKRWYLVAGATALTAAVLWYARTDTPAPPTPTTPASTNAAVVKPATEAAGNQGTPLAEPPPVVESAIQQAPAAPSSAPASAPSTTLSAAPSTGQTPKDTATQTPNEEVASATAVTRVPASEIAPAPETKAPATATSTEAVPARTTASIAAAGASANGYTIQIASYVSVEVRDEYLQTMQDRPKELRTAEAKGDGKLKNLLVYGTYPDYGAAARAIKTLPPRLQKAQPFPVKLSKLKPTL